MSASDVSDTLTIWTAGRTNFVEYEPHFPVVGLTYILDFRKVIEDVETSIWNFFECSLRKKKESVCHED